MEITQQEETGEVGPQSIQGLQFPSGYPLDQQQFLYQNTTLTLQAHGNPQKTHPFHPIMHPHLIHISIQDLCGIYSIEAEVQMQKLSSVLRDSPRTQSCRDPISQNPHVFTKKLRLQWHAQGNVAFKSCPRNSNFQLGRHGVLTNPHMDVDFLDQETPVVHLSSCFGFKNVCSQLKGCELPHDRMLKAPEERRTQGKRGRFAPLFLLLDSLSEAKGAPGNLSP